MPKIVTVEQMQAIEAAADKAGHAYADMMDVAGQAVAERILNFIGGYDRPARVVVLVGTGNNGGDGLVAARYVKEISPETEVSAYLLKPREDEVFQKAKDAEVFIADFENDKQNRVLKNQVAGADVLVDAIFGTGTHLPIKDDAAKLLKTVNSTIADRKKAFPQYRAEAATAPYDAYFYGTLDHLRKGVPAETPNRPYIIAVDCPSGLNCDTGEVDPLTLKADETVTFGAAKPGQLTFPGADYVGTLFVAGIGLQKDLKELKAIKVELSDLWTVVDMLPERSNNSHKGTFGKAFLVAGSFNFVGAAYLAGASAYRVGAGLVTLAVPQVVMGAVASRLPEATWVLLPSNMGVVNEAAAKIVREEIGGYTSLLIGPGLGNEDDSKEFIRELLKPKEKAKKSKARIGLLHTEDESETIADEENALPPMVIDADGLNILAEIEEWWKLLPENTILTPHPLEFARLAKIENKDDVQANRVQLAQEKAAAWKTIVVLKGAFTVIAAPDGRTTVSPFAFARLATAGTGDVLAGAIAGLLAQGLDPYDAAVAGVWLHGWAGTHGAYAAMASEVSEALSEALSMVEEARL